MTLSGIGETPCYDEVGNIIECPATFQGVVETMTGQAGSVIGAGASAVGEGIGTGITAGASGFAESVNMNGLLLIGIAVAVLYAMRK